VNEERKNGIQSSLQKQKQQKCLLKNAEQNVEKSITHEKLKYSRNIDRPKPTYPCRAVYPSHFSLLDILLNFDSLVQHESWSELM